MAPICRLPQRGAQQRNNGDCLSSPCHGAIQLSLSPCSLCLWTTDPPSNPRMSIFQWVSLHIVNIIRGYLGFKVSSISPRWLFLQSYLSSSSLILYFLSILLLRQLFSLLFGLLYIFILKFSFASYLYFMFLWNLLSSWYDGWFFLLIPGHCEYYTTNLSLNHSGE